MGNWPAHRVEGSHNLRHCLGAHEDGAEHFPIASYYFCKFSKGRIVDVVQRPSGDSAVDFFAHPVSDGLMDIFWYAPTVLSTDKII